MKKKSKAQKKADAAFIKKIGTIGIIASGPKISDKNKLHKLAEQHGVPTSFDGPNGEKFTLKAVQDVKVVGVHHHPDCPFAPKKKHDDSGEESFTA